MFQLRLVPVYLALCSAFPSAALAQETDEKILQTVKVTAARADGFVPTTVEAGSFRGTDIMEVPSTVNVVTREVLELQAAGGLYDACLLYTSPSPRDGLLSRMPSSA